MRPLRLLTAFVLLGPLATVGCSSTSGRCEDLCQYLDDCGLDPAKDCKQSCEDKYDDASSKCQDAFDEYADCISDADLKCSTVADDCSGSGAKFVTDCAGQI